MVKERILRLGIAVLGWAASGFAARAAEPDATVTIQNFAFEPQVVTVTPGTTVTWTNRDPGAHALAGRRFHSPHLDSNTSYSFTFREPGTYEYYCPIHPQMRGGVVVK